jgi:hypothetical protein
LILKGRKARARIIDLFELLEHAWKMRPIEMCY